MSLRTSDTDPIYVNLVAPEVIGLPGRLGMTIAPGKKDLPGAWDRDLERDLARLKSEYRTRLLVPLVEEHELRFLEIPDLLERAKAHGIDTEWFPIRDVSVPTSAEALVPVVERILGALREGHTVVVHCRGGLGRSGVVVACCLVALGTDAECAMAAVRAARTGAIEVPSQEAFVRKFAGTWERSRAGRGVRSHGR